MKQSVCAVHDSAASVFGRPFFVTAKGQAVRSFTDEVNRAAPDNELNRHPEDFTLYEVAVWDDNSGTFEPTGPSLLIRGKDAAIAKE